MKSLIELLNLWLLQFFFIRIYWVEETDGPSKGKTTGYGVLIPVVPMSGWNFMRGRFNRYIPTHPWHLGC